jgi:hypothetical protein
MAEEAIDLNSRRKTFANALQTAKAAPKPKGKGKDYPIIDDDKIKGHVDRIREIKAEMDALKAELAAEKAPVLAECILHQDEDGFNGQFAGTYKVLGTGDNELLYVSANSWSVVAEDQDKIVDAMGAETYGDLMLEEWECKVRPEVFSNPVLQSEFMDLLGEDFGKFLEAENRLKPCKGFTEFVYRKLTEEQLEKVRLYMKQKTASLR